MEHLPPSLEHVWFEHYARFNSVMWQLRSVNDPKVFLNRHNRH